MRELLVEYNKEYSLGSGKDIRYYMGTEEVYLEEKINKHKERKRMPYPIATDGLHQLWKFFIIFRGGKMCFLQNPRYKIRRGTQWFEVIDIKIID